MKVLVLRAFRDGVHGMVRRGQAISVSEQRGDQLVRTGLATYDLGAKMLPVHRLNKMVPAAPLNKGAGEAAPDSGGQEASAQESPTDLDSQESLAGGPTGDQQTSQSSSRPARRRKASTSRRSRRTKGSE